MDVKLDLTAARARLEVAADALGVRDVPDPLIEEDGGPGFALLAFCGRYGVSLDWIFCGDVTPLIRSHSVLWMRRHERD